jgi:hypothetical protein
VPGFWPLDHNLGGVDHNCEHLPETLCSDDWLVTAHFLNFALRRSTASSSPWSRRLHQTWLACPEWVRAPAACYWCDRRQPDSSWAAPLSFAEHWADREFALRPRSNKWRSRVELSTASQPTSRTPTSSTHCATRFLAIVGEDRLLLSPRGLASQSGQLVIDKAEARVACGTEVLNLSMRR